MASHLPDFSTMIAALVQTEAGLPDDVQNRVRQTHASAVILLPKLAYKLKKPYNFGFFDYSTPARRRFFCQQEVLLNRRLAPDIYLGVAPVLLRANGTVHFGPVLSPEELPQPGEVFLDGVVCEYAVVMKRLADEATLEARVRSDTLSSAQLDAVASHLATFHQKAATNATIAHFGAPEIIRQNWEENFAQVQPYLHCTIDQATDERIQSYVRQFLTERAALFEDRIRTGWIRDCHGDIRLPHVYLLEQHDFHQPGQRIAILDCIEFNDRFRYSDSASDVAFLLTEFDMLSRVELSRRFIERYLAEIHDPGLRELLPFYQCYRAYVRGKVFSFQLDERELSALQRQVASATASAFFALADNYAGGSPHPMVCMVGGLMGTGKSTLARLLQRELGWEYIASDPLRKRLAGRAEDEPCRDSFGEGLYSAEWTARTYETLLHEAEERLTRGHSVLLDATFLRRADRLKVAHLARQYGGNTMLVECVCSPEIALPRLAKRWQARLSQDATTLRSGSLASDGRPELYAMQRATWEPYSLAEEGGIRHVVIDTAAPPMIALEHTLEACHHPRLACGLS